LVRDIVVYELSPVSYLEFLLGVFKVDLSAEPASFRLVPHDEPSTVSMGGNNEGEHSLNLAFTLICDSFMNEHTDSNLLILGRDGDVEAVIFNRIFIKYPFGGSYLHPKRDTYAVEIWVYDTKWGLRIGGSRTTPMHLPRTSGCNASRMSQMWVSLRPEWTRAQDGESGLQGSE
jgi:hypothetical protein